MMIGLFSLKTTSRDVCYFAIVHNSCVSIFLDCSRFVDEFLSEKNKIREDVLEIEFCIPSCLLNS